MYEHVLVEYVPTTVEYPADDVARLSRAIVKLQLVVEGSFTVEEKTTEKPVLVVFEMASAGTRDEGVVGTVLSTITEVVRV